MAAYTCDGCATCATGFQLSADKKSCTACSVAQCTGGYDTNTCNCKACASGYQGATCTQCATTQLNCAIMAANMCNGCATCDTGYSLNNGACTPCNVANCGAYTVNTCTCTACSFGYRLSGGSCSQARMRVDGAGACNLANCSSMSICFSLTLSCLLCVRSALP